MNRIQELKAEIARLEKEEEEADKKKEKYQYLVGKCVHIPDGSYNKITSICSVCTNEYGENVTFGCINFYFDSEDNNRIAYINSDGWGREYIEDIEKNIIGIDDFNKALNACIDLIKRKANN